MPGVGNNTANVPIGLDVPALMPCGCRQEDTLFEEWAVGSGTYTKRRATGQKAGWIAVCNLPFILNESY